MELNGSKYLTNEEMAVINAMRRGAKICVDFHGLRELDEADALMELFSGIEMTSKYIHDLTGVGSIAFSHWGDHVQANYYIKK